MSEVITKPPAPARPEPRRDAGPGHAGTMANRLRCTDGFDAQAALLTPVQQKPDPLVAGRASRRTPTDERDPRQCNQELTSEEIVESADDRPPPDELYELCSDAADSAAEGARTLITLRGFAISAAMRFLAKSADEINASSKSLSAILEKTLAVVGSVLLGVGLARIGALAGQSIVKMLIKKSLEEGSKGLAHTASKLFEGEDLSDADFLASAFESLADDALKTMKEWNKADIRDRLLAATYPHAEAQALSLASQSMVERAYDLQYATTIAAWPKAVNEQKGGALGVLDIDVSFGADGTYSIEGADFGGMGKHFGAALARDKRDGSGPLTLASLLTTPSGGFDVIVRDQSQDELRYSASARAIVTPDNHLFHHHVGRWGASHLGAGMAPVVYAHRFIFEALGAKTFAELGVQP